MNIEDLHYYVIDFDSEDAAVMLDTLLARMIDVTRGYHVHRLNKTGFPWQVCFWATEEEFEAINKAIDREMENDWDWEYDALMKGY